MHGTGKGEAAESGKDPPDSILEVKIAVAEIQPPAKDIRLEEVANMQPPGKIAMVQSHEACCQASRWERGPRRRPPVLVIGSQGEDLGGEQSSHELEVRMKDEEVLAYRAV